MGNRSNIRIDNYDVPPVYLYSHWGGESVIESAVAGLKSARVGDPAYLARIVFQHMLRDESPGEETGYGISADIQDNEHPILRILSDGSVMFEDSEFPEFVVPRQVFLDTLESIKVDSKDWRDLAGEDRLYDVLIPALAEKVGKL